MPIQVLQTAVTAAQELIDSIRFAPGEENANITLDDLELTDALFETSNSNSVSETNSSCVCTRSLRTIVNESASHNFCRYHSRPSNCWKRLVR